MNKPLRKPPQPWIPERKPAPRVVRVQAVRPSPNGVLKAGWWLCIVSGLIVGGTFLAMMQKPQGWQTIGMIGYYASILLYGVGSLGFLALVVIAMVRGAVGRGLLLLFAGPVVYWVLAVGLPLAYAVAADKREKQQKREAAEERASKAAAPAESPVDVPEAGSRKLAIPPVKGWTAGGQ